MRPSSAMIRVTRRSPRRITRSTYRQTRSVSTFGPTDVPPIRDRLKPLIPFFIKWSIITSLAVNLLQIRIRSRDELGKCRAQESVLKGMIERVGKGEELGEEEMRRDMEMVGLRERTGLTRDKFVEWRDTADVGWVEALFGRKKRRKDPVEEERNAADEWAESKCFPCAFEASRAMSC
jgi:hypothetical protein